MASKAHGKPIVYVAQETKGSLTKVIDLMPPEVKNRFMAESGLRFVTYDQAIHWILEQWRRVRLTA